MGEIRSVHEPVNGAAKYIDDIKGVDRAHTDFINDFREHETRSIGASLDLLRLGYDRDFVPY